MELLLGGSDSILKCAAMARKPLLTRKRLIWLFASLLGCVFLIAFGYAKHLFEGEWRWLAIGGLTACWLVISVATWIAAKDIDKAEAFLKRYPWKW